MANTYTQIHIQAVFVVQHRNYLIHPEWQDELYKYITGIVQNYDHKLLAINGMPDHIHVFFGMRPTQSIADLLQEIKSSSSQWINEKNLVNGKFSWQKGYGAFSYSKSAVDNVINYIRRQKEHHKKMTFHDEYIKFLKEFEIDYDDRYIFTPIDYNLDDLKKSHLHE